MERVLESMEHIQFICLIILRKLRFEYLVNPANKSIERTESFTSREDALQTDMGGPKAEINVEQRVAGMVTHIERLRIDESGSFQDYRGEKLPW